MFHPAFWGRTDSTETWLLPASIPWQFSASESPYPFQFMHSLCTTALFNFLGFLTKYEEVTVTKPSLPALLGRPGHSSAASPCPAAVDLSGHGLFSAGRENEKGKCFFF